MASPIRNDKPEVKAQSFAFYVAFTITIIMGVLALLVRIDSFAIASMLSAITTITVKMLGSKP